MRKIIGIGETILDVIFRNNKPVEAIPGGSVFNGIISLGKMGQEVYFISETGHDHVGEMILAFMKENQVKTDYINVFPDGRSPVSLAFLDENNDADYLFYKDYPHNRLDVSFPDINPDDIVMFGSYFALNPALRDKVTEFLDYARERKAILYYDFNFRSTHTAEVLKLAPTLIENMEYADIVRGSEQDFIYLYNQKNPDAIYKDKVQFYCPNFIYTAGGKQLSLKTGSVNKHYTTPPIKTVSTIAAGDNFNAGIVYGLIKYYITRKDLYEMNETQWDKVIQCGIDFSADVCQSLSNSVSEKFVESCK
jgi:fructokinase